MFRSNKKLVRDFSTIDKKEIFKFYKMLLKYKRRHPNFKVTKVILKLYPMLDLNQFELKQKNIY